MLLLGTHHIIRVLHIFVRYARLGRSHLRFMRVIERTREITGGTIASNCARARETARPKDPRYHRVVVLQ